MPASTTLRGPPAATTTKSAAWSHVNLTAREEARAELEQGRPVTERGFEVQLAGILARHAR